MQNLMTNKDVPHMFLIKTFKFNQLWITGPGSVVDSALDCESGGHMFEPQ